MHSSNEEVLSEEITSPSISSPSFEDFKWQEEAEFEEDWQSFINTNPLDRSLEFGEEDFVQARKENIKIKCEPKSSNQRTSSKKMNEKVNIILFFFRDILMQNVTF